MLRVVGALVDNSSGSRSGEEGEVLHIRCVVAVLRSARMTFVSCSVAGGVEVMVVRTQGWSSL